MISPTRSAPAWRGGPNKQMIKRIAKSVAWIQIKSSTVTIPNADVLQLGTIPVEIVPAQWGKTIIMPLFFNITTDGWTVPFALPGSMHFRYAWNSNDISSGTIFWNDLSNINRWTNWVNGIDLGWEFMEDLGILLSLTSSPTAGDSDLEVTTYYIVHHW